MENNYITLKLDHEAASKICKQLLEPFDNSPVEAIPTILNAFTVALTVLSAHSKNETYSETEDQVEKMVLDWLCKIENAGGLHFSKYINLPDK